MQDIRVTENASAEEKAAALAAGGVKYDGDKARFDLIPPDMLFELAMLYTEGAKKYNDRNWERGAVYGRWFAAMMRHAWAWWRGEEYDDGPGGTGAHHLIAVIWNATALHTYRKRRMNGFDDRPHIVAMTSIPAGENPQKPIDPRLVQEAIESLRRQGSHRQ
jgi:hypothetical protein